MAENYARNTETGEIVFLRQGESFDDLTKDWVLWRHPKRKTELRLVGETETMYRRRLRKEARPHRHQAIAGRIGER